MGRRPWTFNRTMRELTEFKKHNSEIRTSDAHHDQHVNDGHKHRCADQRRSHNQLQQQRQQQQQQAESSLLTLLYDSYPVQMMYQIILCDSYEWYNYTR